jgi:cytochrome c-type biogenesis protein CcmH
MRFSGIRKFVSSKLVQCVLVAAVVCFSLGATDAAGRFDDLGHKMMCTCGCAQVLLECNHVGCTYSTGMRQELSDGIASGQNDKVILAGFVQRYGAVVLTAPTTQGFDLLAWIMPFAVAFLALAGTIYLVRHWSKQQKLAGVVTGPISATAGTDEAMRERIRRETGTDGGI